MSNSSLVTCTILSPNNSGTRTHAIDRITPHCVVGQLTASAIGGCFKSSSKKASCNYGIGKEGGICLVVDESKRSWCSSSNSNDQRAVTIECASDATAPYAFNSTVYNKLIALCADICKRNGKTKLIWFGDKTKSLNYTPASNEMVLTVHRWFANKACPGDWLYSRMGDLANQVNAKLSGSSAQTTESSEEKTGYQNGDIIKLKEGATYTSGKAIPAWVLKSTLYYRGKNALGILFSTQKEGAVTGTVNESMLVTSSSTSTSISSSTSSAYIVQVTTDVLNIRKGPGTNYAVVGSIKDRGKYTIVEEKNGFGRLKSNAGWISLTYTKKL